MTHQDPSFLSESNGRSQLTCADALVNRLKKGDSVAAYQLHQLFTPRLLLFLRDRINPVLNRRLDAEDVLQSAFRSFFRVVGSEDWDSQGRAERVWSLLYAITLNKLRAVIRLHTAGKRSVTSEQYAAEPLSATDLQQAEVVLLDEFKFVMQNNTPHHQQILEQLLSGYSETEVAELNQCSIRTVYRVVERVTTQLQNRLSD